MKIQTSVKRFLSNESGASAIEYGLIGGLISVVIIASVTLVGGKSDETFDKVATAMEKPVARPAGRPVGGRPVPGRPSRPPIPGSGTGGGYKTAPVPISR